MASLMKQVDQSMKGINNNPIITLKKTKSEIFSD